jgi:hypothetical protein
VWQRGGHAASFLSWALWAEYNSGAISFVFDEAQVGLGTAHGEPTNREKPVAGSGFVRSRELTAKEERDLGHISPRSRPGTRRGPSRIIINAREVGLMRYMSLAVQSQTAATPLVHQGEVNMGLRQRTAAMTNVFRMACLDGAGVTILELG